MAIFYVCGVCVTTSVNSMFSSNTMYNNNSLINLHHILLSLRCFINLNFFCIFSEAAGELGWFFTLIIVSVISAILGAIIMIVALRWR